MSEFRIGDVVELRARCVVREIRSETVYIKFHDLPNVMGYPARLLTNLSVAREMSEDEARKLMDDEL